MCRTIIIIKGEGGKFLEENFVWGIQMFASLEPPLNWISSCATAHRGKVRYVIENFVHERGEIIFLMFLLERG